MELNRVRRDVLSSAIDRLLHGGPRLWNSLPVDVQSASSLATFRHQKLKTRLFRQSYPDIIGPILWGHSGPLCHALSLLLLLLWTSILHCHSPGVATVARRHCRTSPAHRCPRQRRRRQQRQRVTEGTAMAPWNGPNNVWVGLPK